jgi:YVTN family beta-propeller protein
MAASIEHPALLPVYEAGDADGRLYMAMRFVDGGDLAALLRRERRLDAARAVALVGQVAGALDAAHARGLIHRDVKPSNVLISTDDEGEHAFLVDFGVTQDTATEERLTATGQLVGTLDYLAPERIRGEAVDGRADLYALGCVLFQCITGELPFARGNDAAALYAHLEEQTPRPSELRPELPTALDDVVAKALAKAAADRWQSGAELRAAAQAAMTRAPPHRARTARRAFVAGAAAAALVLAGALAFRARDDPHLAAIDGDAVGVIDPDGGEISAPLYRVGRDPGALAVGGGLVWSSSQRDDVVSGIDRAAGQVVKIPVRDDPAGMAFAAGSLWVANRQGRTLSQIDPRRNALVQEIPVGNGPSAVAAGFGALWVASSVDRKLFRVDLQRARKTAEVDLGTNAGAVATGAGAVWAASEENGSVYRIEPRPAVVSKTIRVGNGPVAVVATDRAVWVANRQDGTVSRIDPATDSVRDIVRVGRDPVALAATDDGVWVANSGDGTLSRISGSRVVDSFRVGAAPTALAVADGALWTAARPSPAQHRGGTLVVRHRSLDPGPWTGLEPGSYEDVTLKLLSLAHDGLVAYRRTDSSTYGALVGALATNVPEPSPDGRTYVFKLRPGLRYSDGTPVRPEDFRVSIEQYLTRFDELNGVHYYESVIGARECATRPERCDLSKGIVTDATAGTITLHLSRPDPEMLDQLAFPFAWVAPARHPFRPETPVPSTGPYRALQLSLRDGVRFVRNPHFRPRDGRPDGLPDEIKFNFTKHFDANVAAVERGSADAVIVVNPFGTGWPPSRVSALAARAPGRLFTDAGSEVDYMFLNVRTPPFADPRVRRALNYAVDRRAIERRAGGTNLATLACGLPPPGFPGYAPSCRYTLDPTGGGGWAAPDLARARRLVAASGTKGEKVTVWGWEPKRPLLAYVAEVLTQLGYRTSLKVFPDFGAYNVASDSRRRAQIGIIGWQSDVATPSDFATQFRCANYIPASTANQNLAGFCDRRIERRAREARLANGAQADAIWQDVYRMLDEAAPYVALVHRRSVTLVSERVGNYQAHPLYGPLYEQMWVR